MPCRHRPALPAIDRRCCRPPGQEKPATGGAHREDRDSASVPGVEDAGATVAGVVEVVAAPDHDQLLRIRRQRSYLVGTCRERCDRPAGRDRVAVAVAPDPWSTRKHRRHLRPGTGRGWVSPAAIGQFRFAPARSTALRAHRRRGTADTTRLRAAMKCADPVRSGIAPPPGERRRGAPCVAQPRAHGPPQ